MGQAACRRLGCLKCGILTHGGTSSFSHDANPSGSSCRHVRKGISWCSEHDFCEEPQPRSVRGYITRDVRAMRRRRAGPLSRIPWSCRGTLRSDRLWEFKGCLGGAQNERHSNPRHQLRDQRHGPRFQGFDETGLGGTRATATTWPGRCTTSFGTPRCAGRIHTEIPRGCGGQTPSNCSHCRPRERYNGGGYKVFAQEFWRCGRTSS
mmetsp:Transcript_72174/g.143140  ORF Transcript_72174/g.143140 Transcript_72174/m.143140 type:complete len:207 (+) Transcript_72174:51-671(+)